MTGESDAAVPSLAGHVDFGATRTNYVAHRAAYPDAVYDRLAEHGIGRPGQDVLDIGAGTGLLSRPMLERGVRVVALDVSLELLSAYSEATPTVALIRAGAEGLPLTNGSFDAVLAGQCWHWFDRPAAAAGVRRVLRPGGAVAIVHFDWIRLPGNVVEATEDLVTAANPRWNPGSGHGLYPAWLADLAGAGFTKLETFSFDASVVFTHESWRGRLQASAGIRGSLDQQAAAAVDAALADMLRTRFPDEPLRIPHRVFAAVGRA